MGTAFLLLGVLAAAPERAAAAPEGYYRQPALRGDVVVFVAEGDLWRVSTQGGVATRITTAPGYEGTPAISPDGATLAFTAEYEGPTEIYTMPLSGGTPTRWTYDDARCSVAGFAPDGRLLYVTQRDAGLPDYRAVLLDLATGERERIPLSQVSEGSLASDGRTLVFVRFPFQGSHTKRYQGGTAQSIWRFDLGASEEARCLTCDHAGTDRAPMGAGDRIHFISDRDGTKNLWSMTLDGGDLRQHTRHADWDVMDASLSDGRIVYRLGAGLRMLDVASGDDRALEVALGGDLDHTREKWIATPWDWLTSAAPSPTGDRVVLTARGQVFVAPHGPGRLVEVTRAPGVRYRNAVFNHDGSRVLALSDQGGEIEFWSLPPNGVGEAAQITRGAEVLRWEGAPSPDGRYLAHHDKDMTLWLTELPGGATRSIDRSRNGDFAELRWSPDSRWLAYVVPADNTHRVIRIYDTKGGAVLDATTDRFESFAPAWGADGTFLYLLSDRNLRSLVRNPWGARQPEPYYDRTTKIYALALSAGLRSPFVPPNETTVPADEAKNDRGKNKKKDEGNGEAEAVVVTIEADGLAARLHEAPIEAGNYAGLFAVGKRLYWLSTPDRHAGKTHLMSAPIVDRDLETVTVAEDVQGYEPSADGEKILIRKSDAIHIVEAGNGAATLDGKTKVDLSAWSFPVDPREEWRQMFTEAWRLERDYFYDRGMHGVDWPDMLRKYLPLVDRVHDRAELSDLLGQLVSELSALHIYVYGGDFRSGKDEVAPAALGADLVRDAAAGGYRIERIYASDPDRPELRSPLAEPGADLAPGDVILTVNGDPALDGVDLAAHLRNRAGRQVLLGVRSGAGGKDRQVVVEPISLRDDAELRYHEWEYTRRLMAESLSDGRVGYVHLRAMGGDDIDQWTREFYPVFQKEGLILDVRHNRGGNIESWILEKLMRKAWMWWQPRIGAPSSNMQYAFLGHSVVLVDERTASDGEAFAEGFRRLGMGKVIGTRTWGGEIWLTSSNILVDRGIATAAEFGVYGPEGEWLIEGHGVDPDVTVDNLPHATYNGRDAQLEAAVEHLLRRIAEEPVAPPPAPPYPDKSFGGNSRNR